MKIDIRDYQLSGAAITLLLAKKQKILLIKKNPERNYKIVSLNSGFAIYSRLKKPILLNVLG